MNMWKEINPGMPEYDAMITWARKNYAPLSDINGTWHPIVQQECVKINIEEGGFTPVEKWKAMENDGG